MDNSANISDLASLRDIAFDFGISEDEYLVAYFNPGDLDRDVLLVPTSINGLTYVFIKKGSIKINVDFKDIVMEPNSMMCISSKNCFSIKEFESDDTEVCLLNFTVQYMHDLNFDLHSLNLHEIVESPPETVTNLSDVEARSMEYLAQLLLINANNNTEPTFARQIGRSLTQALVYEQLHIFSMRRPKSIIKSDSATGSRQLAYVQEFMRQLQLHHTHHRSISFYADKLCISQKYLSHVIKDVTGRSASDWIAEFVVMEAKNLLRFSNKNVQQVAYSLNFPTQSSFGKYFKHVTGISPTEFQKS